MHLEVHKYLSSDVIVQRDGGFKSNEANQDICQMQSQRLELDLPAPSSWLRTWLWNCLSVICPVTFEPLKLVLKMAAVPKH